MLKSKLSVLLYALTSGFYINLVGRLVFSELIALVSFPFTKFSFLFKKFKNLRFITKGFLFLFIAQIISDIVNESIPNDYLRGLSVILFSYISIIYLLKNITKNSEVIILYFIVMFFMRLLFGEQELDIGIISESSNFFKQRFVGFLNLGFMIFSYYSYKKNKQKTVLLFFFMYSILCFVLDARSNGLIFLIATVILYIKNSNINFKKSNIILLSLLFTMILYIGYVFYINKVLSNEIGGSNSKTQIAKMNNPYNPFELLYYGRLETVIAMSAISEKPFIGYGSWAVDKDGKYARLTELLADSKVPIEKSFIPSHSVLLGAWLYAGLLGFVAMFSMFRRLFIIYFKILKSKKTYYILPVLTVLTVDMMWASVFSPFGLLRTTFPIFAAMLIYYEQMESLSIKKIK
jgi:hypothetical protein